MDAVSYNAILTACAQGGNWVGARRLIEGLAAKGVLKVLLYGFCSFKSHRGPSVDRYIHIY